MERCVIWTAVCAIAMLAGRQSRASSVVPSDGPFIANYFYDTDVEMNSHVSGGVSRTPNADQQEQIEAALEMWSAATDDGFGRSLIFVETTNPAAGSARITIGNRTQGFLGLGGGIIYHGLDGTEPGSPQGIASMQLNSTWLLTNMPGYFTVAAHEIGHALTLGHDVSSQANIMDWQYTGPKTELTPSDISNIRAVWGVGSASAVVIPEPSSLALLALALLAASEFRARLRPSASSRRKTKKNQRTGI